MDGRNGVDGDADPRYRFTSKERDAETGLDYFGARYYDSRIGRWLSVDPMADFHTDYSPFAYVYNNPVLFIDPLGLDTMWTYRENGTLWGAHWIPDNICTPENQGQIADYFDNQRTFLQAEMSRISDWWNGVQQGADGYVYSRMNGQSNGWNTAGKVRRIASTANGVARDLTMASPTVAAMTKVTGGILTGFGIALPVFRKIIDKNYNWSEAAYDESSAAAAFEIGLKLSSSSGALTGVGLWYAKLLGNYYSDLFTGENLNRSGNAASGRGQ